MAHLTRLDLEGALQVKVFNSLAVFVQYDHYASFIISQELMDFMSTETDGCLMCAIETHTRAFIQPSAHACRLTVCVCVGLYGVEGLCICLSICASHLMLD